MALLIALHAPLSQLLNPPPPPPSTPCTSSGNPCVVSCDGGASHYFLSGFNSAVPSSGYYKIGTGADTYDLFMGCGVLSAATCADTPVSDPVGMAVWSGEPPTYPHGGCGVMGSLATQKCSLAPETGGLMCYYTGGDDGRDVTFNYRCHDAYGVPQVTQGEHITKYTIDMAGPGGCARVAGLSIGSLTLILSGVAIFVYIAGGIFYNHRYREMPVVRAARPRSPARTRFARAHPPGGAALRSQGVEAIPLWSYWKQLPGLVYDGCKFSYEQSKEAYEKWNNRHVEGAEVKQGLKAAEEEGAATATQYEAHTQEQAERLATEPPPAGGSASGSARNSAA